MSRALVALVCRDLLSELRGREVVPAMLVFVVAAFVLFRFGLGGEQLGGGVRAATGMLWVAVVFTAMLGLTRAFAVEREHGLWDGLLCTPVDRGLLWAATACSTLLFLVVMQAVALPLFWLFFLQQGASPSIPVLVAALLIADAGIAALGALLAGLASAGHARELLLPVLFLPFAIPLVLIGVELTVGTIPPQSTGFETVRELGFLALYATIFALLGWALFEYVVED